MKRPATVLDAVRRRLKESWHESAVAGAADEHWPQRISLGLPGSEEALAREWFDGLPELVMQWREWVTQASAPVTLESTTRRVAGTLQELPVRLVIPTVAAAATVAGPGWERRLKTGTDRLAELRARFPSSATGDVIRTLDGVEDEEFTLLLEVADWLRKHPDSGLTPRQVPVPGIHSKWFEHKRRRGLLLALTEAQSLGLNGERPHPINFTYLDPAYRASGGRLHDSVVAGDRMSPAYAPKVVVISENKDTAQWFPELEGGIALQGSGHEGYARVGNIDWIATASELIYWGDIDSAGFEILNSYRERGIPVATILMDADTLRTYARFGISHAPDGKPLTRRRKPLEHLTAAERKAYEMVTDPSGLWPARLEQERIPLDEALGLVRSLLAD
jgi:hypothetical protein